MKNIGYIICESQAQAYPAIPQKETINGKTVAEGILQTANEKNRNGRYYDSRELFPQLTAPRTLELLNCGYMRGEMGHPLDSSLQRQSTIDDTKTCARFMKFWTEGNDVWSRFVGTNNAYGHAFDMDLKEGCWPAWSLRALGSIETTPRGAEVRNLRLITYDQVIYPSHPGAYTQKIVSESTMAPEEIESLSESTIIPITNEDVIKFVQSESQNLKFVREYFDFEYNKVELNENQTKAVLTTKDGDIMVINLENYIHNELMGYAEKFAEEYL